MTNHGPRRRAPSALPPRASSHGGLVQRHLRVADLHRRRHGLGQPTGRRRPLRRQRAQSRGAVPADYDALARRDHDAYLSTRATMPRTAGTATSTSTSASGTAATRRTARPARPRSESSSTASPTPSASSPTPTSSTSATTAPSPSSTNSRTATRTDPTRPPSAAAPRTTTRTRGTTSPRTPAGPRATTGATKGAHPRASEPSRGRLEAGRARRGGIEQSTARARFSSLLRRLCPKCGARYPRCSRRHLRRHRGHHAPTRVGEHPHMTDDERVPAATTVAGKEITFSVADLQICDGVVASRGRVASACDVGAPVGRNLRVRSFRAGGILEFESSARQGVDVQ